MSKRCTRSVPALVLAKTIARQEYMAEWNWQSQRCVRAVIDAAGGSATDERFWLTNMMVATLTWDQIQAVAEHPHVQWIDPNYDGSAPP